MSVPATQKAIVFDAPKGPLEIREIPVPDPGPNEVLVRVLYSGVCHSDLHLWRGDVPARKLPIVGGHEGVGTVEKLGSNVENLKVGDTVGIKWQNSSCDHCEDCVKGSEETCNVRAETGFTVDGTFQQFAVVYAKHAHKVPEGVDLATVAPLFCAGLTAYRGLKESGVKPGEWMAITGAGGGLGSLAIQFAKAMGMRVLAIDVGEAKKKHCRELGAEVFVDAIASESVRGDVIKATKGGAHGVLNLASATKAIEETLWYVRKRGTIVLVGVPANPIINFNVFVALTKAVTVKGSLVGSRRDMEEALSFVSRGLVKVPAEIHSMSALPDIYERLQNGTINGRVVLDLWKTNV